MQAFRVEHLREKLGKLNTLTETIKSTAFYIQLHKVNAREIIQVWLEFCGSGDKLSLLYLASDVIHHEPVFRTEFGEVLPTIFEQKFKFVSGEIRASVGKVLQVWKDRLVYPVEYVENLERLLGLRVKPARKLSRQKEKVTVANPALQKLAIKMNDVENFNAKKLSRITKINSQTAFTINELKVMNIEEQRKKREELVGLIQSINEYKVLLENEGVLRADLVKELKFLSTQQEAQVQDLSSQFEMIEAKRLEIDECFAFVSNNVDGGHSTEVKNPIASVLEKINAISNEPVEF